MKTSKPPINLRCDSVTAVFTAGMLYELLRMSEEKGVTLLELRRNGERVDLESALPFIAEASCGDVQREMTFAFIAGGRA
jgi:hypothetical protein